MEGLAGIKATVVAHSTNESKIEMLTYEIEYPRIILSEANTHRMLSKNSASSRAIPFAKMAQNLTGRPVSFGANQSGMQAGAAHTTKVDLSFPESDQQNLLTPEEAWNWARDSALDYSRAFSEAGYHKQVFNRLTEPFQMMKTVISGTEWSNFFWLRDHNMADPTLHELARCMAEARTASSPTFLKPGEWHLPYVMSYETAHGQLQYYIIDETNEMVHLSVEDAIKVSVARSAAVSFRNIDYGVEKCREVYQRLIGDERKHASAFEHAATPMYDTVNDSKIGNVLNGVDPDSWQDGVSHCDRDRQLWSGNLRGWIQHRKLIPGENYTA